MAVTIVQSSKSAYRHPDPALVREQLGLLQDLFKIYGAEKFCEFMFWILRKNPEEGEKDVIPVGYWNKRLVPFKYNRVQRDIESRMTDRNICLKYRQGGYTTFFIIRRLYLPAVIEPGAGSLLISQNNSYAAAHFLILRRVHKVFGAQDPYDRTKNEFMLSLHENLLHTQYSSRHEIIFDQLDSRIMCASAEVEEVAQGLTLNHVQCSEVSRWPGKPEETMANMKEAVAAGGTIDIECTPNGMGGYFFEECMRARDPNTKFKEYTYFFHEWWWQDEYRDDEPFNESELTEYEQTIREKFNLDLRQMNWRHKKYVSLRHNFAEKYPEDDMSCFLLTGHSFFDNDIIRQRTVELSGYKPLAMRRGGDLQLFHRRVKHREYVIGADPATGRQISTEDTDFCAAVVLDKETGEEVAALRARITPDDFGRDLAELAHEYNDAVVAVERTGDGTTTMLAMSEMGYHNIFKYKEVLKRDIDKRIIELEGIPTTTKTRPTMLNKVRDMLHSYPELVWDRIFLGEATTFVRNEKGKPEAQEGAHDDTVLCRAIGHFCRLILLGYIDPLVFKKEVYGEEGGE